jgi:phosphoglycolate phosphatase-like HAD superfamily hydrolase
VLLLGGVGLGIDPLEAWYVGDAKWDMLAAKAAGMVPLGVTTGATGPTELRECGAVATFVNLDGLLDYVSSDALAPDRGTRELGD